MNLNEIEIDLLTFFDKKKKKKKQLSLKIFIYRKITD